MTEPRTAAGPTTKHGQYVLTVAKSWNWPAFDMNDILAIEAEARAAEAEALLNGDNRYARGRAAALDEARAAVEAVRHRWDGNDDCLAAIDALREAT